VTIRAIDALAALRASRRADEVVITTMATARDWMLLTARDGAHALDFIYVPSSMSQATSLGLGLALAQPARRVIVCNGDGSMLMNLGSLVTIAAAAPTNLVVLVFENGVYEVTGAQPTPASLVGASEARHVDFVAIAEASGLRGCRRFDDLSTWQGEHRALIESPGPTFAVLHVDPVPGAPGPRSPGPAAMRARTFMRALQAARVSQPRGAEPTNPVSR
jgi:phosphonopyruvate decarboxylase